MRLLVPSSPARRTAALRRWPLVFGVGCFALVLTAGRLPAQLSPSAIPGSAGRGAGTVTLNPPPAATPAAAPVSGGPGAAPAAAVPAAPVGAPAPAGYVLSPDDQVAVEVYGEDELRTASRLSAEGTISMPLIGAIKIGGLTTVQAAARITEALRRDYLVNPRVGISLLGYARRRFTVLGQVNRPGAYEMPEDAAARGGMDLLEAIAMAGGYTAKAQPGRIDVVRKGSGGGAVERFRVDGKRLARGQASGKAEGFLVQPGDSLTIGESIF